MSKKDRIAIVISVLALFPGTIILDANGLKLLGAFVIVGGILIAYWGFRFIQGDISFLQQNKDI